MSHPATLLPPLIVIAGATGTGKTALSVLLAEQTNGEIINADSRSFYRGMDIGTAKVEPELRQRVPHHLIDILDPGDDMSLSLFQQMAMQAIDDVLSRGKLPFLVGGTPQYLNAVVENWKIPEVAPDASFRRNMEQRVREEGVEPILRELRAVDPASAERTGPNPRRIIRALEVHRVTGRPMSELQGKRPPRYRTLQYECWLPRDILHQRIAHRIDLQVEQGLFAEVRALLESGVDPEWPVFSTIGYREVVPFLQGTITEQEAIDAIRFATNRLVRHQQTWARKNPHLIRIDMNDPATPDRVLDQIRAFIASPASGASN